ncbi:MULTISPECIES: hypothetical protein [unclassified Streptomyces]|uniref:hypothetical protein n=1 Tax=unclassified Streptomyces TaxID=2593676 RepID=UPI001BE6459D|nr:MULTISPECIES: hypothetical protein [unclassified Streptomyces]MBT2406771.1 hypothetical protein [Streptomyces sp. ISL-21]MBT2610391.1 hypothetical protein [Streptomyces sp. ISL-87]
MTENKGSASPEEPTAQPGEPTQQTCLQVARQTAMLAVIAADDAMTACAAAAPVLRPAWRG